MPAVEGQTSGPLLEAWGPPGDYPGPPAMPQYHLLDLPTELLHEILRGAPRSLRTTCRLICDVLDADCQSLTLHRLPKQPWRVQQHVAALLQRTPLLRSLNVRDGAAGPKMQTLAFLAACPFHHLASLTLAHTDVPSNKLQPLAACQSLTSLTLVKCNRVRHINALASVPSLRSVALHNCRILTSIAPLAHCPSLTALSLEDSRVAQPLLHSVTALRSLVSLQVCNLQHPGPFLSLPAPMSTCIWLRELDLSYSLFLHLRPLAGLTGLTRLLLTCCVFQDPESMRSVAACASLTHVDLCGSSAQRGRLSVMPLAACASLRTLLAVGVPVVAGELDRLRLVCGARLVVEGLGELLEGS